MPITINDDVLIPDDDMAREWNCSRRTLSRMEAKGLPYVIVAGVKYRPQKRCRSWLQEQIREPNPRRKAA